MSANEHQYNAAEAATILLKNYKERRQVFHAFNNYDKSMDTMRSSAGSKIAKLEEPLKRIASRLFDVMDKGFFLFRVCEWKLDYFAEALLHAIEAKNPLSLASNARGLVEHLAALVALIQELEKLERSLQGKKMPEQWM